MRESLHPIKQPNRQDAARQLQSTGLAVEYFPAFEQQQHDFHTHEFIEILYVIRGNFRHVTADRTYDETAGGLTLLNYRQFHTLTTPDGPVELMNLYWNPVLYAAPALPEPLAARMHDLIPLHPVLSHRRNRILHLNVSDPQKVTALLKMLLEEQKSSAAGREAAIQALFRLLLIEICRAAPAEPDDSSARFNPRMEQLRLWLDRHFTEPIRMEQLCEQSGLQPANLCRQFKTHTGLSTGDYLKQRRLAAALQKLRATDDKILTICHECGFADISRFNRTFRAAFGCTPSAYRKTGTR